MKRVASRLYVGSQADLEALDAQGTSDWPVLLAAKEPYHREFAGYTTRAAPDGPTRLWVFKDRRLALNLIDGPDPKYVTKAMIDVAISYLDDWLGEPGGKDRPKLGDTENLLIACNQGGSRAPTLAMLYLAPTLPANFEDAYAKFREDAYPELDAANGIREFARIHWPAYRNRLATGGAAQTSKTDPALDKAQELWREFCRTFADDPSSARDQLIASIRTALQQAANGKWPRADDDSKPLP